MFFITIWTLAIWEWNLNFCLDVSGAFSIILDLELKDAKFVHFSTVRSPYSYIYFSQFPSKLMYIFLFIRLESEFYLIENKLNLFALYIYIYVCIPLRSTWWFYYKSENLSIKFVPCGSDFGRSCGGQININGLYNVYLIKKITFPPFTMLSFFIN